MRYYRWPLIVAAVLSLIAGGAVSAHPLGNFTINHYARLEVDAGRIQLRYVVDMAEIAAFQELQRAGIADPRQEAALAAYAAGSATAAARGLVLTLDGARVPLRVTRQRAVTLPGAGGLPTLRLQRDLEALLPPAGTAVRRLRLEDTNQPDRIGWREMVVTPAPGVSVFDSSAFGSGLTDELKAYPADLLAAPPDERVAQLAFCAGPPAAGSRPLRARDGRVVAGRSGSAARDRLAALVAIPRLTPFVALIGMLIAFALGGLHALSPGHGKTVVAAYLVGSRGTPRHALFLGVTVTMTHTAGVFALGVITLVASRYVVPERLYAVLSFLSGLMIAGVGAGLLIERLRALASLGHLHGDDHGHAHAAAVVHSHGGSAHTHLPPGADGQPVRWRQLLALGISGGMLPCPSALIVLLSAIALGRVAYGLALVLAFSMGLASVLTGIGLAFVWAGRLIRRPARLGAVARLAPVAGAFAVTVAGIALCAGALPQGMAGSAATGAGLISATGLLGLGFALGLRHAFEADHLAAVTTIVSERKSVWSSSLVGGLWGLGHTASLLVAGAAVLLLHLRISERTSLALEFCVALMLVGLGASGLRRLLRGDTLHRHAHRHGEVRHTHAHFHAPAEAGHNHAPPPGVRPLLVGMVHGLAGSAALTLLLLAQIRSPGLGLAYIALFGLGSVGGMMAMSALVGLPVQWTAARFRRLNAGLRAAASLFSVGLGGLMIYQIGFVERLLR